MSPISRELLLTLASATRPIFVWDVERRRIPFANEAGLRFWGEASITDLAERAFEESDPLVRRLAAIAERLRPNGTISETLQLTPQADALQAATDIKPATLKDGRTALIVEILGVDAQNGEAQRRAALFAEAPVPLMLFDAEGATVASNDAAALWSDAMSLAALFDSPYLASQALGQTFARGGWSRAVEVASRIGVRRARVTLKRILDPATGVAAAIAYIADIEDRPHAEAPPQQAARVEAPVETADAAPAPIATRPTHDTFEIEAVLGALRDAAVVADTSGAIVAANARARQMFGEVSGRRLVDLLPDDLREDAADYLAGAAERGLGRLLEDGRETAIATPRGRLPVLAAIVRISDDRALATFRDLSAAKAAEAQITGAREDAESANRQKSDFLASISHELRTPLNAIIGFAEIMEQGRMGPLGNARYEGYARDIRESGHLLLSLINDLLDLSKAESGRIELDPDSVELAESVRACTSLLAPLAEKSRVTLTSSVAKNLPAVVADERSVKQILINLVGNAIKYNRAGGTVDVSVVLDPTGAVVIAVSDSGSGMSDDDVKHALEPYRRVKGSSAGREGTGLGLPLARALAEANKAAFAITSAPGRGTTVKVTFPSALVLAS